MEKFECNSCVNRKCTACLNPHEVPKYCTLVEDLANWHKVKEEQKLPKLTAEVFNHPDCPEWANYAVVNHNGRLSFFGDKPKFEGEAYGCWSCDDYQYTHINNAFFDPTDWENSLVERPAKALPDWCKVEKWGYDTEDHEYFEIVDITPVFINVRLLNGVHLQRSYNAIKKCCVEAKKRPFNEKEMKELVGKVIENPNIVLLVNAYGKHTGDIGTYCGNYTAESLMDNDFVIDDKPCYVLEHLNEKGEWVE